MRRGEIKLLNAASFQPYGHYYKVEDGERISADGYQAYITSQEVISRPLKFGITVCDNGKSFLVDSMERHLSSEEVQFTSDKPVILSVADSDPWQNPREEDVVSFFLMPGDVVVLNRGIWHDACHSIGEKTMYYFLSYTNGEPSETKWLPVTPNPVCMEL